MATASKVVFYSASPFGTGDIKTGSPTLTISSGVATLSVAQTGNIGAGDCIDFGGSNTKVYIAPCRIGYDSGSTEIEIHDKIRGVTSGAVGIVRAVETTSGTWGGGDAAGYIYFRKVTGTFQDDENINRVRPTASSNVATINGTLQGNMSTQFVVKDPDGTEADNVGSSETVNSIHHVGASLDAVDALYTGASYINNANLTAAGADIMVHICGYYDHDDQTLDTTAYSPRSVTADADHYLYVFIPQGEQESINTQRHEGIWSTSRYMIEVTSGVVITCVINYVRFEGLQVSVNDGSDRNGFYVTRPFCKIGYCIIKGTFSGGDIDNCAIRMICPASEGYAWIWNNSIYDFINGSKNMDAIIEIRETGNLSGYNKIYNNTIVYCYKGVTCNNGTILKNNIINDCTSTNYTLTSIGTATHNIGNGSASELAFGATYKTGQADGTSASKLIDSDANFITNGVKVGCVVMNTTDTTYTRVTALDGEGQLSLNDDIFVSGENYSIYTNKIGDVTFNNEGADDFHLGGADAFAKNLGTNLSADANLPFWNDIDGDERL